MGPKTTLWKLEPHTVGKHRVLENYLKAWFAIMGQSFPRILFIDGFAGPGQYEKGEEGSPVIAVRTYLEHQARRRFKEVVFGFIEANQERAKHLECLLKPIMDKLPDTCTVDIEFGRFDEAMTRLFDELEKNRRQLAPAFIMIDPFGVSDTPMEVISKIFRNSQAEVYASFMYESINRFKKGPEFEPHLDSLFGCPDWRNGVDIKDPEQRKDFFFGLYASQLRKAGARHVLHLELYKGQRLMYAIFFGTTHWMGSEKMKRAIWKVAPFGDFSFHGTKSPQLVLGLPSVDYGPLKEALQRKFRDVGWVTIEQVEEFVGSDETDYHVGHLRKPVLNPMEESGELEVDESTRKKKKTYRKGCRLRFR